MLKKVGCLTVVSLLAAQAAWAGAPAQAPESSGHVYIGGQLGYVVHYGFDNTISASEASVGGTIPSYAKRQGSFGARVFAGYLFNRYVGLELGAGTYGSQKFSINPFLVTSAKSMAYNVRSNVLLGFDADLVGQLPLAKQFYIFAKAGMAYIRFQTQNYNNQNASDDVYKDSNWNWMPRLEVGFGYDITDNLAVTLSYANYFGIDGYRKIAGDSDLGEKKQYESFAPPFGMASIGLTYAF